MRCPKCGKFNWGYAKSCKKCGVEFSVPRKKKHHRLLWIICIVILCLLAGFFYLGISMNRELNKNIVSIQDNLEEAAVAKTMGDSIKAGKPINGVTMNTVQTKAITAAKNLAELSVPDELKNYQATAILWSVQIANVSAQPSDWKNLKNQPSDFPLALNDADAENCFRSSIKVIEDLKDTGADAVKNKDREAMRQTAAKLLVQKHWLNAILYSQKDYAVSSLVAPVFAASQDLQVPEVGKGVDVTCSVCDYPDAYKVHWTDELRRQYGCDTRCHPKTTSTEGQTATNDAAINDAAINDDAKKYADSLAAYNYDNATKRAICIGNNVGGVFCVEEAVQSTNEIAASAMGFADNTKALTVDEWNNEYKDIDLAVLPADKTGETGVAPSQPSAEGGHQEGGMGTIQEGKPTVAPKPTAPKGGFWDGSYSCNITSRVSTGQAGLCDGFEFLSTDIVNNHLVHVGGAEGEKSIDSSGNLIIDVMTEVIQINYHFSLSGNQKNVVETFVATYPKNETCTMICSGVRTGDY